MGVEEPLLVVISNSMWPELSRGDIVIVQAVDPDSVKVDDVIVFRHEHGLTVHRVVSLDEWTITTKGDANPKEDSPIYYDDVVGRVPSMGNTLIRIPWAGHFALLANPGAAATDPDSTVEITFWDQLRRSILSPLGIILIGIPLIILFQDSISEALYRVMPLSNRKRRIRTRVNRMKVKNQKSRFSRAART